MQPARFEKAKRFNFQTPWERNLKGNQFAGVVAQNSYRMYEQDRESTGPNFTKTTTNRQRPTQGIVIGQFDAPKTTLKETTLSQDNTGQIKTSYDKGIRAAVSLGLTNYNAKTTQKEMSLNENYVGIGIRRDKPGSYLVSKYQPRTTQKEIISANPKSNYTGNRYRNVYFTDRTKFMNAEIFDTKEKSLMGARIGGPQWFQISASGGAIGDIKFDDAMKFKEIDYDKYWGKVYTPINSLAPNKYKTGGHTLLNHNKDNDRTNTITNERLQPELAIIQHAKNPYSIYAKSFA